jgi:hypothetical protein
VTKSPNANICKYAILAGLLGQILVLLLILRLLLASERISPSAPGESPSKTLNGSFHHEGKKRFHRCTHFKNCHRISKEWLGR